MLLKPMRIRRLVWIRTIIATVQSLIAILPWLLTNWLMIWLDPRTPTKDTVAMQAEVMSRFDIVRRRYEAMRMRWPERRMDLIQQEMLVISSRIILKLANRYA